MTVHNYRCRQVHETLNGVNPSSGFRDMRSAKSGSNLWQIWQVFGPWASPYGANGQMSMTVHNYRPRQFHRTSNGENPSSGYRDMGSASLAAARPTARPPVRRPARPAARTVTTIPLQPGGLRGKKRWTWSSICNWSTNWMMTMLTGPSLTKISNCLSSVTRSPSAQLIMNWNQGLSRGQITWPDGNKIQKNSTSLTAKAELTSLPC